MRHRGLVERDFEGELFLYPNQADLPRIKDYEVGTIMLTSGARGMALLLAGCLLIAGSSLRGQTPSRQEQPTADTAQFRVDTNLVSVPVSVTDNQGRPFVGLTREDFEVFENKVAQEISFFSLDDSPLAVGLVLDSSGSMRGDFKMERAQAAALHFVQTSNPQDEVFLVDFDSQAALTLDFTSDLDAIAAALSASRADGRTALYDAVYLALEKLDGYQTERRKVILLISDGADTASRYSSRDVDELAREAGVQIYAVGICGMDVTMSARSVLEHFAEISGGRIVFTFDSRLLVQICNGIALELRAQYALGYQPTNPVLDGKWRKIKVKVKPRKGRPHLVLRAREGYYARDAG